MKRTIIIGLTFLFLAALTLSSQSLRDNPDYRKARELEQMAARALTQGEYDKAYEYAEEAKIYAAKAEAYAAMLLMRYKANGWRQNAESRMRYVTSIGAPKRYPDEYTQASASLAEAQAAYKAEEYEKCISASQRVLDLLKDVRPAAAAGTAPLPRYYKVRLIPADRDCFNKIAGYPFVYNDRFKWKPLYEANKGKIQDPNNPHLIQPNQVFEIPSLAGEQREGTYDPQKKYPVFQSK